MVENSLSVSVLSVDTLCNKHLLAMLSLPQCDLFKSELDQIIQLILSNSDVFALDDSELGMHRLGET